MSTKSSLGTEVLRDVSRSFYLSLRLLPSGFRAPASMGYLLARLSDTIADSGAVEMGQRLALLEELGVSVARGEDPSARFWASLKRLSDDPAVTAGEGVLLHRAKELFPSLRALEAAPLLRVQEVLATIVSGQAWDLTRFQGGGVVRLTEDAELDRYTHQVAGCVGEFWTHLGFLSCPRFSSAPPAKLESLARSYGQGLQLVNILRDVPEDLTKGRCYLPGPSEPTAANLEGELPRWLDRAEELLNEGLDYCEQVRPVRVGMATGLPVLLGKLTLARLRTASWDDLAARVKVTRSEVKRAGLICLRASLSKSPTRWHQACRRLVDRG